MSSQSPKPLRVYQFLKHLPEALDAIREDVRNLEQVSQSTLARLSDSQKDLEESVAMLANDIEIVKQWQADNASRLASIPRVVQESPTSAAPLGLQADNHELDGYYLAFENEFRGTEGDIYERLKESYTELLTKKLPKDLRDLPVVDIGCGRGEMLRLLKELNLQGVGIDLNRSMVERCKQSGYEAIQDDALAFLRRQPSSSLSAIGGIHIVEHVPFEQLLLLLKECYRTISPGGFAFFETPNAENVVVGSLTFWYDSSHLRPVPPKALAFMLRYVGFSDTEIMRMHPAKELPALAEDDDPLMRELAEKTFGPRDYTAIGIKKRTK